MKKKTKNIDTKKSQKRAFERRRTSINYAKYYVVFEL